MNRFERQIILPDFGNEKQNLLKEAKVLLIGAGGLGCPALLYLAAAGVGTIGIADGDTVHVSNLNRQILFGGPDIGQNKAILACQYVKQKYSDIEVLSIPEYITNANALEMISGYDLVIDGSDNFETRYMINDACVLLEKPLITGAVYQLEGHVGVLNVREWDGRKLNYRDAFPLPPSANEIPNCEQTGVLGVVPGIIGTLQAAEAIKLICAMGENLLNKLLYYNFTTASFYEISINQNRSINNPGPQNKNAFLVQDYALSCAAAEISWEDAIADHASKNANSLFLDVRNLNEKPELSNLNPVSIPLSELKESVDALKDADKIYIFCQTGMRSKEALVILKKYFPDKIMFSIKGGILKSPYEHNK